MVRAARSLNGPVTVGKDEGNTAEAQAPKAVDKMSDLWALVKGLSQTPGGKRGRGLGRVDADRVRIRSVITAGLSESKRTVTEAICDGRNGLLVEASFKVPGPSIGGSSHQA